MEAETESCSLRQPAFRQIFLTAEPFPGVKNIHLDILPEALYPHLECLPKNNESASNYCRVPWIC
jgi:hypothetical protein